MQKKSFNCLELSANSSHRNFLEIFFSGAILASTMLATSFLYIIVVISLSSTMVGMAEAHIQNIHACGKPAALGHFNEPQICVFTDCGDVNVKVQLSSSGVVNETQNRNTNSSGVAQFSFQDPSPQDEFIVTLDNCHGTAPSVVTVSFAALVVKADCQLSTIECIKGTSPLTGRDCDPPGGTGSHAPSASEWTLFGMIIGLMFTGMLILRNKKLKTFWM